MNVPLEVAEALNSIVAADRGKRGVAPLCSAELWGRALSLISGKKKMGLISGFFVPKSEAPETDGPPGTLVLARALMRMGIDVRVGTDVRHIGVMKAVAAALDFPLENIDVLDKIGWPVFEPDLLIYIERLGHAADGAYYNMRKEDISAYTEPLDLLPQTLRVPLLAVGDGGNEVGMGNYKTELSSMLPDYAGNLCVVEADVCLPVDVSNWGGYALVALLSMAAGRWLGQSAEEEGEMFRQMMAAGAVDGVTCQPSLSVDGFPLLIHTEVLAALETLFQSQVFFRA